MIWTEKHELEALKRTYELAAEMVARGDSNIVTTSFASAALHNIEDVATWTNFLRGAGAFSEVRIRRELRRVDSLATGRLIRRTTEFCRIQAADGKYLRMTRDGRYVWARSKREPPCLWDRAQAEWVASKWGGKAMPPIKRRISIMPVRNS